jgi:hypothetical protein
MVASACRRLAERNTALPSSQRQNGEFADLNDQWMLRLAARDGEPGRDERLRVGASHQGDASLRQAWLAVV